MSRKEELILHPEFKDSRWEETRIAYLYLNLLDTLQLDQTYAFIGPGNFNEVLAFHIAYQVQHGNRIERPTHPKFAFVDHPEPFFDIPPGYKDMPLLRADYSYQVPAITEFLEEQSAHTIIMRNPHLLYPPYEQGISKLMTWSIAAGKKVLFTIREEDFVPQFDSNMQKWGATRYDHILNHDMHMSHDAFIYVTE